jgi:hypothetical protein
MYLTICTVALVNEQQIQQPHFLQFLALSPLIITGASNISFLQHLWCGNFCKHLYLRGVFVISFFKPFCIR